MLQASSSSASIAHVAARSGYYDQARLHRDFLEFAGCAPGRLLADDLPSFQDDDSVDPQRLGT
jgi:AraC-like DNA-binding protein